MWSVSLYSDRGNAIVVSLQVDMSGQIIGSCLPSMTL